MKKIVVICGPTASGKTSLGVSLASRFTGEIVSADSRQVYQLMDIGTGKDVKRAEFKVKNSQLKKAVEKKINIPFKLGIYQIRGVPLWGLDLVKPDQLFSLASWLGFAEEIIKDIWQRKKLPIIVGGTGFWIKALLEGVETVGFPPDYQLRKKLTGLTVGQLKQSLRKVWPQRLEKMNQSDKNNPRRLIRAIEVGRKKGRKVLEEKKGLDGSFLVIGLKAPTKFLYQKIDRRVEQRIKQGAEQEVKELIKKGYGWQLQAMTAAGYQEWRPFFKKKTSLKKVIQRWKYNEHQLARRQLTWFNKFFNQLEKKEQPVKWFNIQKADWQEKVVNFLKSWYDK